METRSNLFSRIITDFAFFYLNLKGHLPVVFSLEGNRKIELQVLAFSKNGLNFLSYQKEMYFYELLTLNEVFTS